MADEKSLDVYYASQMRNHPYGTALYTPLPFSQFHPGSTGYFSSTGSWNPITDLSLPSQSPQITLSPAPSESYTWGPKLSTSTRAIKSSLDVGLSSLAATGLPVDIGAFYSFTSEKEGGSILLTRGEVRHERFYYESPFKDWVRANAERIATERREVRDYGLWIVTSTWSVQEAAVNCWREEGKSVGAGFKTGIVGLGECAPSGEYIIKGSADGWVRAVSKESENGKVVFFGGLRFRFRKIPFGEVNFGHVVKAREYMLMLIQKLKIDKTPKSFRGEEEKNQTETLAEIVLTNEEGPEKEENFQLECEPLLEVVTEKSILQEDGEEYDEW